MKRLDDSRLVLKGREVKPLMVGGMGVDISSAALALEAARLGGVGHISDAMSPYVSDKYYKTKIQNSKLKIYKEFVNSEDKSQVKWAPEVVYNASLEYATETMSKKRGDGLVFANVMEKLTMGNPKETLRARLKGMLDGGIDGVTLSAGLHNYTMPLMEDHPRFRDAHVGIIVSSLRALKIFLRSADRVKRMPDYIVVEGPLAGGHLGFGDDWMSYRLEDIVVEVVNYLKEAELDIPVIPAGGVFTGTDAVRFLELGAGAVQVATRFTISKECGLPEHIKQEYIRANEDDVVVNNSSPTGYLMRMLRYSPSLQSTIRPNCEALGYLLDGDGKCAYHQAYKAGGCDEKGNKLPIAEKMCICYHFMNYNCYTCGHNVYRLKDTTIKLSEGVYYLPSAEHIFTDYLTSTDGKVVLPQVANLSYSEQSELSCAA